MASINIISLFCALNACLSMLFVIKLTSYTIIKPLNCHHEFLLKLAIFRVILITNLCSIGLILFLFLPSVFLDVYTIFTSTLLSFIPATHCRLMNFSVSSQTVYFLEGLCQLNWECMYRFQAKVNLQGNSEIPLLFSLVYIYSDQVMLTVNCVCNYTHLPPLLQMPHHRSFQTSGC